MMTQPIDTKEGKKQTMSPPFFWTRYETQYYKAMDHQPTMVDINNKEKMKNCREYVVYPRAKFEHVVEFDRKHWYINDQKDPTRAIIITVGKWEWKQNILAFVVTEDHVSAYSFIIEPCSEMEVNEIEKYKEQSPTNIWLSNTYWWDTVGQTKTSKRPRTEDQIEPNENDDDGNKISKQTRSPSRTPSPEYSPESTYLCDFSPDSPPEPKSPPSRSPKPNFFAQDPEPDEPSI